MYGDYSVESLGKLRMYAGWRLETLHIRRHHQLFWIGRGQGRITVGGLTRGYRPNTAVYVPAGTAMALELGLQTQGLVLGLPIDPDLDLPEEPFQIRVTEIQAQSALTGHIEQIERERLRMGPAQERALKAQAMLVSVWIARQLDAHPEHEGRPGAAERLTEAFAALIEEDVHAGLSVAEMARQLGVTATHLSRACKAASGRPAHAMIQERLMHEARRLLRDTTLPARDIARALGFSSPAYFSRAFGQATGVTPSAFRAGRTPR